MGGYIDPGGRLVGTLKRETSRKRHLEEFHTLVRKKDPYFSSLIINPVWGEVGFQARRAEVRETSRERRPDLGCVEAMKPGHRRGESL